MNFFLGAYGFDTAQLGRIFSSDSMFSILYRNLGEVLTATIEQERDLLADLRVIVKGLTQRQGSYSYLQCLSVFCIKMTKSSFFKIIHFLSQSVFCQVLTTDRKSSLASILLQVSFNSLQNSPKNGTL